MTSGVRVKICAGVILALLFIFVPTVSHLTEVRLADFGDRINAIDTSSDSALEETKKIYNEYRSTEEFLSLSLGQRQSAEIEDGFTEMISYLENGMNEHAEVTKDRLSALLVRLGRSLGIDFDLV